MEKLKQIEFAEWGITFRFVGISRRSYRFMNASLQVNKADRQHFCKKRQTLQDLAGTKWLMTQIRRKFTMCVTISMIRPKEQ